MDITKLINKILDKNKIKNLCFMIIGIFLLALNYNLFLARNDLVIGGVSGLAIIFNKLLGWNDQMFIYIVTFLLLILSFAVFGLGKTKAAIVGSLLYPIMITFTEPLSDLLINYFAFEDFITTILFSSILYGLACGLIYKMGYDTGGSDIIMLILVKYLHMPEGKASFICNIIIILFGGIVLGFNRVIYAIIILYISSILVDRILIGISSSKLFIIYTNKQEKVMNLIVNELHLGVTVMSAKGGYSKKKQDVLMCVVPTKNYYMFKEIILAIDKKAFFIINDCYDTHGGTTNSFSSSVLNSLY